jgi:hypothetical protein
MVSDRAAAAARVAANELSVQLGQPKLRADVELALYSNDAGFRSWQYFDPLELSSVIVSFASLAWQIYETRRERGEKTDKSELKRQIRLRWEDSYTDDTHKRVIEIIASEIAMDDASDN